MKGIINVNKPQNWTSFDVVSKLKSLLHTRHIGHLGTLDPMATGVLPVTIGSATKIFDMFLNKTKCYRAKFEFGYLTDTLDATGIVVQKTENIPTEQEIKAMLNNFVGEIEQIPPQFSAKKVNGKKAYDIARTGGVVELKPKVIFIKKIDFISYKNKTLELDIECGAGTYIRAIGRDLSQKLHSLATMTSLIRTRVGIFDLDSSIDITKENEDSILTKILKTDVVFDYPIINDVEIVNKLLSGQIIKNFNALNVNLIQNNAKTSNDNLIQNNDCNVNLIQNNVCNDNLIQNNVCNDNLIQNNATHVNLQSNNGQKFRLYLNNEFVALAEVKDNNLKMTKYFN